MSKISFIVIGRNEGWKLTRCLKSIIELIKHNNLSSYEIIYVDSNSTDDSIRVAMSFNDINVFRISGIFNAAIARNIGARESTGDVLFFIDGDMELNKEFLPSVYTTARHYHIRLQKRWYLSDQERTVVPGRRDED